MSTSRPTCGMKKLLYVPLREVCTKQTKPNQKNNNKNWLIEIRLILVKVR